jgi:hypothetical protein
MTRYFGLRGQPLATARVFLIVVPSFLLFGYNQSAIGGVLGFKSFTDTFPRIDTVNTSGDVKANNSTIQGIVEIFCASDHKENAFDCSRTD